MQHQNIAPAEAAPFIIIHDNRESLAAAIEVLIARMDALDGDPDLELNGDERDGCHCAEDEFQWHSHDGPGCPLADPDRGADDDGEAVNEDGDTDGRVVPLYGVDQTRGPINGETATREHLRSLRNQ